MLPLIGQTMNVSFPNSKTQDEYQIVAIAYEDSTMLATMPAHVNKPETEFGHNQQLLLKYRATDGALLSFQATVVQVSLHPPQLELRIPHQEQIHREQKREFVRVSVGLPVRVESLQRSNPTHYDLHIRDISGGGMAVLLPPSVSMTVGSELRARFTLPNDAVHVDLRCSVVRISERNQYNFAVCSMQFVDIKESMRQKIIQYTFMRQRELSKLKKNMSATRDA